MRRWITAVLRRGTDEQSRNNYNCYKHQTNLKKQVQTIIRNARTSKKEQTKTISSSNKRTNKSEQSFCEAVARKWNKAHCVEMSFDI